MRCRAARAAASPEDSLETTAASARRTRVGRRCALEEIKQTYISRAPVERKSPRAVLAPPETENVSAEQPRAKTGRASGGGGEPSSAMRALTLTPLLLCTSRAPWHGLCCTGADVAGYGRAPSQLERRPVEASRVGTGAESAAGALRHARAGPVDQRAVWRHVSITACMARAGGLSRSRRRSTRRRTAQATMCEREETDLGEREETALELEEVSESEIDLVPATGFFALSALELLSAVDASTPRGDDAPFHPGKRQPSPWP